MPKINAYQQNRIFISDIWTVILRKLTAREQTPLRRVNSILRGYVDNVDITTAFTSGYGRLLARFKSPLGDEQSQAVDALTFRRCWKKLFRKKLVPLEVDFFTAVICGDVFEVEQLLGKYTCLILLSDECRNLALHFAARQGDMGVLNRLFALVPDEPVSILHSTSCYLLAMENSYKVSPLELAVQSGQLQAIQWFIQRLQAYITRQPANLSDALIIRQQIRDLPIFLVRHRQWHLVSELIDMTGMVVINRNLCSLLHMAAANNNVAFFKYCQRSPGYNKQWLRKINEAGHNVLLHALKHGHSKTVNFLLAMDKGLVDTVDVQCRNALYYAIQGGRLAMVKKIIALRPALLRTPYQLQNDFINEAIRLGNLEILSYLLQNGVLVLFKQRSSLVLAVTKFASATLWQGREKLLNYFAIIRYLIGHLHQGVQGSKYTQVTVEKDLFAALRYAEQENALEIVSLLKAAINDKEQVAKKSEIRPFYLKA